jgi:Protein of unknown function (DUF3826)
MRSPLFAPMICLVSPLLMTMVTALGDDQPATKSAADEEAAYTRAIEKRADDILDVLKLEDAAKARRVRRAVLAQYRGLRAIQDSRDAMTESVRAGSGTDKERAETLIRKSREEAETLASSLNQIFLSTLSQSLAPEQVEQVKDKMTFNKLQVTYNGYLEMLPRLTEDQKRSIRDTLVQARDRAVYAGSAEEKTEVFNKFKGRINNYLSSQGYDLKRASAEWAERLRQAKSLSK